ncbi:UDP-N-acetylglucosamine 3-dehydrogenase [uncultured archaeon]|nr:UDP-N-acetylglucosamine 3-dehydrogenase [uncultured archaeon]
MKKLKTAIIGLGHQATEDHIPGLKESQFAELKAICDIDEPKLKECEKKLNVNGYVDYKELLGSEDLDFIIVATPHNIHKEVLEEAAKRKVNVLKEKPFARNLKEAFYFKKLCDESGIVLTTTLQRRFNPIYTTFFQLVDQIGEPFFVDAKYTLFVDNLQEGWRGSKEEAGGGCIIDMGYHMIDMLIWYFGLPDKVHAEFSSKAKPEEKYDAEDTASILFSYENDLYGSLILSRYYPPKTESIKVIGSKGIIEIDRGSIKRLKSNGEVAESLTREYSWPVAAANQIDYFCRVVNGDRENIGSPKYHLKHVSFIDACYESKEKGKYVNPKELLDNYEK